MEQAADPGGEIRRSRSTEVCDAKGRGNEERSMEGCRMRVVFGYVQDLCGACVCVCVCVLTHTHIRSHTLSLSLSLSLSERERERERESTLSLHTPTHRHARPRAPRHAHARIQARGGCLDWYTI